MTRKRSLRGRSAAIVLLALLLAASVALANGVSKPGAGAGAPGAAGQAYPGAAGGPPVTTARFTLEFVDAELIDVFQ
ncbi:MAG: hypothetical protein MUQ26_01370, partial [Armatimonadetes bacterium]|nr:hypothetical protein [Armatimonadota bacterium]